MASMTASVGRASQLQEQNLAKNQIAESIGRLSEWLEKNDYRAYDPFDGLSSPYLRPLTFETNLLRTVLQQGVRRFPINMRPVFGIPQSRSTKGMGFLARGFVRMHQATGEERWAEKTDSALQWLTENRCKGYSGACWGNHFDYQSRTFYLPKGIPTIVWTSLIGHAFLDAFEHFQRESYLDVAVSACEHIVRDLQVLEEGSGVCISYIPNQNKQVHNSNTLGASLLARVYGHTRNSSYRSLAQRAMQYAANHQRSNASWFYGEAANLHWVDNFHTAYVLDCFKHYQTATGDTHFDAAMERGYQYWKRTFFLSDGTPRYYDYKTLPLDIQCSSQAIDTLVFFSDRDPESLLLACKVAASTIKNMQDSSGYFYYRRYSGSIVNKTPTLHWGQATMFCALAALYKAL